MPRLPLLLLFLALAACQSAPRRATSASPAAAKAAIHGRALCVENPTLAGALLEVQMIDDESATIARQAFAERHGPPYDFTLPYDTAKIDANHRYALRATLRDAAGHLECATAARVPFAPGGAQRAELRLVRTTLR